MSHLQNLHALHDLREGHFSNGARVQIAQLKRVANDCVWLLVLLVWIVRGGFGFLFGFLVSVLRSTLALPAVVVVAVVVVAPQHKHVVVVLARQHHHVVPVVPVVPVRVRDAFPTSRRVVRDPEGFGVKPEGL